MKENNTMGQLSDGQLENKDLNRIIGGDGEIKLACGCDPKKPHTCIPPNCPTCLSGLTNDPDGTAVGFIPKS